MADYVDRDRLLHIFSLDRWGKYDPGEVRALIMSVTPEDVRSVVYCKDCKHRPSKNVNRITPPSDSDGYTDYVCPFVCEDSWYNGMPADDDYCSYGEKRELET